NPEKDEQALQMMCRVLTGSVVSILMDRLREQTKYTYHVDARLESLHDKTGYLVIEYKIQYSNLAQSIQEVSNGIATLLSGNFDDRLYEGMRAVMLPQFLQAYSQPGWMIEELLSRRMYKKEPFQEAKRALAVTKRSIIDVANSYLTGKRLFVVN
ncbi:MAG: insulinase family protein, partial [Candidatus Woesearchaeota archaeon]